MPDQSRMSPSGHAAPAAAAKEDRRTGNAGGRHDRLAPYREVSWLLIKYRNDRGLTQQKLAELVGTSHSQISRIESGRQKTSLDMLSGIAHALGLKLVIGFEEDDARGGAGYKNIVSV